MWARYLKMLSPFPYELKSEMPHFIKKALDEAVLHGSIPVLMPIQPVKLLGISKAGNYPDFPNLPAHHVQNSKEYKNPADYLDQIGKCYWFDFDIFWMGELEKQLALEIKDVEEAEQLSLQFKKLERQENPSLKFEELESNLQPTEWRPSKTLELRMVLNEGDADCNDGVWGAVWERNTQELIANILSTGDCETTVHAVSEEEISFFSSYPPQFKTYFSLKTDYSLPCSRMIYKEDSALEI